LTLAVGSVQIIHPHAEAYNFVEADSHDEDLTHVIEVYEFPASLKTEDLFIGNVCLILLLKILKDISPD